MLTKLISAPQLPSWRASRTAMLCVALSLYLLLGPCLTGCNDKAPPARDVQSNTPDRLQAGEALISDQKAFGIPIPRELEVQGRFADSVFFSGKAKAADLTEYFRGHVVVDHLEMAGLQTIFPRVYIKGDASKRVYRIEITALGSDRSKVAIKDITPPPPGPKLSEEEHWARVGMNPDGTLKNRLQLK